MSRPLQCMTMPAGELDPRLRPIAQPGERAIGELRPAVRERPVRREPALDTEQLELDRDELIAIARRLRRRGCREQRRARVLAEPEVFLERRDDPTRPRDQRL